MFFNPKYDFFIVLKFKEKISMFLGRTRSCPGLTFSGWALQSLARAMPWSRLYHMKKQMHLLSHKMEKKNLVWKKIPVELQSYKSNENQPTHSFFFKRFQRYPSNQSERGQAETDTYTHMQQGVQCRVGNMRQSKVKGRSSGTSVGDTERGHVWNTKRGRWASCHSRDAAAAASASCNSAAQPRREGGREVAASHGLCLSVAPLSSLS